MKGIHPSIVSHKLNVLPTARPVRQRVRRFHPDRQKVIRSEIDKLVEARFIREVEYPDWLANVVVVPKKEGKWRVCVDYTNLNNACPKDSFPLPRIDQITDSTTGQGMLSFLDAFSGYHQIPMSPADEEKTAFITPHGLYCYKVRLMTKIFKPLVGRTVEVYIDDIVVKSKTREEHVLYLQEVFHLLRKYDMKLNPSKYTFGVSAGKFLGFMVSQKGIEVSPDPSEGKKLYMYLAVSEWTISAVLLRCPSPKEQKPIYYVSRALADVETRYSKMELTALALRTHPVVVLTDQPLRNILHKPDLTGRMLQWAIELSEYGIEFQPRLSMKGQVMADFVLEYSRKPIQHKEPSEKEWWTLQVDGASRPQQANIWRKPSDWGSPHLTMKLTLFVSRIRVYSDSQLVDPRMTRYLSKVRDTLQRFTEWMIEKIKRVENGRTDALAGIAASLPIKEAILLPIHVQANPSITPLAIPLRQAKQAAKSTLPKDPKQAHKIRVQAARFTLIGGHLYKRSFTGPYLRCLNHLEALYVLAELHEGVWYYWPTMKKDAAAYVKKCDKCQRHAPIPHVPLETLKPISSPWPFAQWGIDIKFLLVTMDYFSKWVEAEAYASIKDKDVTKFVWKNIIYRFGIPQTIIADNGPQFDSIAFRNFCSELHIRNSYSTPRYPQSNGQAEATNKTLITALKNRLEQAKGKWVEELPGVLWAYRTTPGRPTGNTSFALAYGMGAIIPTEIGLPTIWTEAGRQDDANTELGRNLDWADEVRETASIRMADYQQRASAHYNRKARPRSFKNGTLVFRKVFENTVETGRGKFQANWEGPYIVYQDK
uniref:Integrase catalytic domain-containing protein n=1 Tax=Vitis vinifera TaxID=29760 RepID=A5AJ95_VITVI|nr:hypothetical protein VITISV_010559 [Vitis vinifera]